MFFQSPGPRRYAPYLVDVQSDLLEGFGNRVVIPLRRLDHFPSVILPERLTPVRWIEGKEYWLETPKMGAVPRRVLKSSVDTHSGE